MNAEKTALNTDYKTCAMISLRVKLIIHGTSILKEAPEHIDYKTLFNFSLKYSDKLILILSDDFIIKHINNNTEKAFSCKEIDIINKKIDKVQVFNRIPYEIKNKSFSLSKTVDQSLKHSNWQIIETGLEKTIFLVGSEQNPPVENLDDVYFQNILKYIPGFFYWKDNNSIYQGCNDEFAVLAGLNSRHEVVGKTDFELIWKERAESYVAIDKRVVESGVARLEHVEDIKISSNKTITAITNKVPMKDNQGNVIGLLGITIDITHQKQIEKALALARKKAENANKAKDEFIRNMSHDIRTPLSGIIGMSSILESEAHTLEEKEHAHMVNISGEQLLTLLNSVLDIIASGSQSENQINVSMVNVSELVYNIADLELPTIKLKNLDIRINLSDDLPEIIETDAIKIHRILLNLLGNAVKFTEKGFIEIGARLISTHKKEPGIQFYIKDSGSGIKKEDREKIFRKFYRGTSSYQGIYAGHGVGLHIVKRYTHLLKGKITVESIPGEGATFIVSIPVKIVKHANANTTVPIAPDHPRETKSVLESDQKTGINILLVEDNAVALKMAENLLTKMNIGFQSAANGFHAVELFRNNLFHLVLSDIGLPDIPGTEVVRRFRQLEKALDRPPIPVIGLTAHSVHETEKEALQSGMNEVLSKPIRHEHIANLIMKYHLQPLQSEETETPVGQKNLIPGRGDLPNSDRELFELEQFPLFDEAQALKDCGSMKLLRELLSLMTGDEMQKDVANMQEAFQKGDFPQVEKLAHKIKGGAAYVGTRRMKYACQYLERYWKCGEQTLFEQLYHQAIRVIDETMSLVKQWLKR